MPVKKRKFPWKGFPRGYKSAVITRSKEKISKQHRPPEYTYFRRWGETFEDLQKYIKRMRKDKIVVNDIGIGARKWGIPIKSPQTYEPYELSKMISDIGKKPDIYGYSLRSKTAKKLKRTFINVIPFWFELHNNKKIQEMKESVKLGQLDIVTGTPARKADLTVCLQTLLHIYPKISRKSAIKNLVDSTRKGGYIVINEILTPAEQRFFGLNSKKIRDAFLYQKKR